MYGLINKAVRELIVVEFGSETWDRVRERAQVGEEDFVSMKQYDDAVTYSLVTAASDELGIPAETVLETFGSYWVKYVGADNYGHMMDAAGKTLPEFLMNLDQMHSRVMLTFPDLKPPSFQVTDQVGNRLRLHYYSARKGLAPLVVGLLNGLAEKFDTPIQVEQDREGSGADEHDVFDILMLEESAPSGPDSASSDG
jgi:hypothetical protein